MNTIEEQLWNYIDGNCNAVEKTEMEAKIASNLQYNAIYQELMAVHTELNKLDFEEPSLSFTRNVMEQVNQELRPVALKTKVDNRIAYAIGGFFVLSLVSIFGYVISTSNLNFDFTLPKMDFNFKVFETINPTYLTIFIMVDAILALLYLDSYLRKGKTLREKR
jgi:ABC-type uncharacterized transport system fused permease/ATPase subunit